MTGFRNEMLPLPMADGVETPDIILNSASSF